MLTLNRIRELLVFDVQEGSFFWKPRNECSFKSKRSYKNFITQFEGRRAGFHNKKGYEIIQIDGIKYGAHRLAWCVLKMIEPQDLTDEIDHKNGRPWDNRPDNLRCVSKAVNRKNRINASNSLGLLGVKKHKSGKYEARVYCDGKYYYAGVFDTPELAHNAYISKKKELFEESTL